MPLLQDTVSTVKCSKCHTTGPNNFRLERRASFKCPDVSYPDVFTQIGDGVEVWACIKCGQILKEIK